MAGLNFMVNKLLTIQYKRVESDGSKCALCKEIIFLYPTVFDAFIGDNKVGKPLEGVFCLACKDVVIEHLEKNGFTVINADNPPEEPSDDTTEEDTTHPSHDSSSGPPISETPA